MDQVKPVKFYKTSETCGYAVEKIESSYRVVFVEKSVEAGQDVFTLKGCSRSRGKSLKYASVFLADYTIRREILPLYKAAA